MKCTYLRNIRNWRPQLNPHNLLTINYMKLTFPVVISSQSKLRFNAFVECRETLKEITKKSFGPGCKVKLPLNSYKNTVLPIESYQSQTQGNEMSSVRVRSDGWRFLEGFFLNRYWVSLAKSSASNLKRWNFRFSLNMEHKSENS